MVGGYVDAFEVGAQLITNVPQDKMEQGRRLAYQLWAMSSLAIMTNDFGHYGLVVAAATT